MLKSIYGRFLVACICLVAGFIFVVGIISYNIAAKNIRQQVSNSQIEMLDQYRSKVEMLLREIDIISCQGVLEYGAGYKAYSQWNLKEILDTTKGVYLKAMSNDIIESLYLYYPNSGKVIVNNAVWTWDNFYDRQWEYLYKASRADVNDKPYWIYDRTIDYLYGPHVPAITIIRGFPIGNTVKDGYFVVNIKKDAFFDELGGNSNVMIIDGAGNIIKDDTFVQQMDFSIVGTRGFSIENINGKRSMVIYTVSQYNDWKYISIIDDTELLAPINSMRYSITRVIVLCIIIGIIISLLTSYNVYIPIDDFISHLKLQKKHIKWLPYKEDEIAIINDYIDEMTKDRDTANRLLQNNKETLNAIVLKGQELAEDITNGAQVRIVSLMDDIISRFEEEDAHVDYISSLLNYMLVITLNTAFILGYKLTDICGKNYQEIHSQYYELKTVEEMKGYVTDLALQIARYVYNRQHAECSINLDIVRRYIEQHYADENLSLQSIADMVHMNVSYVSSLFKKEMGIGFSEFLANIRIEKAKELLRTTDKNIDKISCLVGCSNSHSFSVMFKRITGMSPSAYRKLLSTIPVSEHLDDSIQNN